LPDAVIQKTISLGVSEFPADTNTLWSCIKFADVALYRAKEDGRNRSVRFTQDMWQETQV
jgi:diguanylate cyclase (GGDEF)-like protein